MYTKQNIFLRNLLKCSFPDGSLIGHIETSDLVLKPFRQQIKQIEVRVNIFIAFSALCYRVVCYKRHMYAFAMHFLKSLYHREGKRLDYLFFSSNVHKHTCTYKYRI